MFILSSRSATVLVIFIVAIVAFCLASVFGAMTGTISILPNESEDGGSILDNLSAITDGTGDTGSIYGNDNYNDYSSDSQKSSDDSKNDVETTTDTSSSDSDSSYSPSSDSNSGSSNVETTTDDDSASSDSQSEQSNVETVRASDDTTA